VHAVFGVTYLLFRSLVHFYILDLEFMISVSVKFCCACFTVSLAHNLIINRQIDDVDAFYCIKCVVVILSNYLWLISVYNNMNDWKLKAPVVEKLKREANMFVSLYHALLL